MREIRSSGSVGGGHPAQLNARQVPPIPIIGQMISCHFRKTGSRFQHYARRASRGSQNCLALRVAQHSACIRKGRTLPPAAKVRRPSCHPSMVDRPFAAFFEYVPVDLERHVHGRHAAVGCHLEEDFRQFLRVAADVQGRVDV